MFASVNCSSILRLISRLSLAMSICSARSLRNSFFVLARYPSLGRFIVTTPTEPVSALAPKSPPPRRSSWVMSKRRRQHMEVRVIPIEVFCHVYRRNREGKHSARGVALSHDSEERAVEHIHFFLELAVSFFLFFAAYKNFLVFKVRRGRQVERDVGERRLESDARRHVHVEDKLLQRLLYFFVGELVVADKRR